MDLASKDESGLLVVAANTARRMTATNAAVDFEDDMAKMMW